MSFNRTSTWLTQYPWCLGGKPTGDGQRLVTLEPNVGPPGTQRLEGMEPEPEEELMSSLGQILARIEEVGRAQAEDGRLFLESLQGPLVLRATPEPQEPSEVRIPEVQEPAELQNPEVQEPAELPTTPVSRGPSAEGRPWFPVTRRRLLIPGARWRCPLPLPRLQPGQPLFPVPLPRSVPAPRPPEPPRPVPPEAPPPERGPSSPEPPPPPKLSWGEGE
ncbi:hypothetical protein EYF80_066203 [Liparis tanakae]|uniref:Uncharacterized protein n=1 Tax=Liparis tanakae TaxID=230148 RepID=A0A4Z2E4D5_9TELE|nr:hypothetical protein EYF80_066203 [Liparis tanakae]